MNQSCDLVGRLKSISTQLALLVADLERSAPAPARQENLFETENVAASDYLRKIETILSLAENPATIQFVTGVKGFIQETGFVSEKQARSIDHTLEHLQPARLVR